MLKYLLNYGVDADTEELSVNYEIDINDVTILQEQINRSRKSHYDLIKLYDKLQGEYLDRKSKLAKRNREMHIDYDGRTDRLNAIAKDLDHIELTESIDALKEAMRTVSNSIDLVKSDIRILTNSMYNR